MARASKRFAGSGRSNQQHTFRNTAAELLKFLGLAQELDDFLQFFLGLFHAGDIFERHLLLLRRMQAGPALSKAEGLIAATLHLAHHEDPQTQQRSEWERR